MNKVTRFLQAGRIGLQALLVAGCGALLITPLMIIDEGNIAPTSCECQVEKVNVMPGSFLPPSTAPISPISSAGSATINLAYAISEDAPQLMMADPTRAAATPSVVPTLTSTSTAVTPPGQVLNVTLPTSISDRTISSLLVYLPPGYSQQTTQRYPVLYLLHGQGDNDDQWVRLGITKTADNLIDSGKIAPLIMVMPYETESSMPEDTDFGKDLATVVVPWIDSQYRTLTDRTDRAIGGLSRGAAWAVRLGLIYWQTFGAIGAHSYPMFYGDDFLIPGWLNVIPPSNYPRLYLDIGNSDPGLQIVRNFEAYLTKRGIPHEYHLNIGYHEEKYWQAHLEDYLLWYNSVW